MINPLTNVSKLLCEMPQSEVISQGPAKAGDWTFKLCLAVEYDPLYCPVEEVERS